MIEEHERQRVPKDDRMAYLESAAWFDHSDNCVRLCSSLPQLLQRRRDVGALPADCFTLYQGTEYK